MRSYDQLGSVPRRRRKGAATSPSPSAAASRGRWSRAAARARAAAPASARGRLQRQGMSTSCVRATAKRGPAGVADQAAELAQQAVHRGPLGVSQGRRGREATVLVAHGAGPFLPARQVPERARDQVALPVAEVDHAALGERRRGGRARLEVAPRLLGGLQAAGSAVAHALGRRGGAGRKQCLDRPPRLGGETRRDVHLEPPAPLTRSRGRAGARGSRPPRRRCRRPARLPPTARPPPRRLVAALQDGLDRLAVEALGADAVQAQDRGRHLDDAAALGHAPPGRMPGPHAARMPSTP